MPWVVVFRDSFYFSVCNVFICLIPDLPAFVFHSQTFQWFPCWVVIAVQESDEEPKPHQQIILQAHRAQHPAPYKLFIWMWPRGTHIRWLCFVPCTVCLLLPLLELFPSPWPYALAACTGQATSCCPTCPALMHIHLEKGGCWNPIKIFA